MEPFRTLTRLMAVVATLASVAPAHADFVSGYNHDGNGLVTPYEWGRVHGLSFPVALLSEFSFEFADSDHHLHALGMTGVPWWGEGTDPHIYYTFEDDSGEHDIYYRLGHYNVIAGYGENYVQSGDCTGSCWIYIGDTKPSSRHHFALSDFSFSYDEGEDHHVDEIAIIESANWLYVAFNDKNDDDKFRYVVRYTWLDEEVVARLDADSGTHARGWVPLTRPDYTAIRGFEFDFEPDCTSGGDHHIQAISVLQSTLSFRDRNSDDCFDWELKWMELDERYAWE